MTHPLPAKSWKLRTRTLHFGKRPLLMGIVNVTPDSFSDGGSYESHDKAIAHGLRLVEEGADLLDIGGESTRPGAQAVPVDEELRRVTPVVEILAKKTQTPISVDTSKAIVARKCLELGAEIINDVSALVGDEEMPAVARESSAGVVLMHMQGDPRTMQRQTRYDDLLGTISTFLEKRAGTAIAAGVTPGMRDA